MSSLQPPTDTASTDTPTPNGTSSLPSPSGTAVDLPATRNENTTNTVAGKAPTDSRTNTIDGDTLNGAEAQREDDGEVDNTVVGAAAEIKLSQKKKWFLLFIFSVAQYLDIASYSGLFVFTDAIIADLEIAYLSSSWIITAYSVTFASFLLLWGRVSDLYSAKPVFAYGFLGVAVTNLIISFMTDQYAYYVFRALSGIFGAATIPSAFRLILAIFEPAELQVALTLFGLSGALANVTGLVLAGFFGFITAGGQQAAWRWFFRMICITIAPFAAASFLLVPKTRGDRANKYTNAEKFKRLDLLGCFAMLVSIILLILGLTLGATYGFKTAKFLVPFLLSWPIFVAFFIWEAKLPEGFALIPPHTWRIPNFTLLIFFALGVYPWWASNQLVLVQRFIGLDHESPIIAAVRMLPQGIAALALAMVVPPMLQKLKSPKWPIAIAELIGAAAYLLFIYSDGEIHNNQYWRWLFPSFIFGSGAAMVAFLGTNITVMTSVPPAMSGVAGAILQVSLQMGAVICLSVQAGFLTIHEGNVFNYSNVQASFWFQFGWLLFNMLAVIIFFRKGKVAAGSEAAKALEAKGEKVETVAV